MNKLAIIAALSALALVSCDKSAPTETTAPVVPESPVETTENAATTSVIDFSPVAKAFHNLALADSKNMLNHCVAMQADITAFAQNPTDASQQAAQDSFLPCYQSWAAVSLYFQQAFDIADQKAFRNLIELIDTRPSLPGYIDGIPEYPFSGLVHELDIPMNTDTLRSQHRLMDEESASVGFPVIEFFLWKMPVAEHWIASADQENETVVERRKTYLLAATGLLIDNLSTAVIRWQDDNRFMQLPERAQLALVLKSLQRLTMIDLLTRQFEEAVFDDPDWHHAAPISGNGRSYVTIKLKSVQQFIGATDSPEFGLWLAQVPDLGFTIEELRTVLKTTLKHVQALPENYPKASKADENWQLARQNLAQLALDFTALSNALQVNIVTE